MGLPSKAELREIAIALARLSDDQLDALGDELVDAEAGDTQDERRDFILVALDTALEA